MPYFTDQLQNQIYLPDTPRRIVSLVPSQTELLFDLGLDNEVVGVTKFCIHPKGKVKAKTKIGGTKNFNFGLIDQLKPDLIIGNKEENYREGIEKLGQKYPVWMSDIFTLEDSLEMIKSIGEITGTSAKAIEIVSEISDSFSKLIPFQEPVSVAYFIWKKPYMAAGSNTFIDNMLMRCGFRNVFTEKDRYPEVSVEPLKELQPEVILLSSEPYPFKEKHLQEFQEICPDAKVLIVDGEMFSWYGSRLLKVPGYFNYMINLLQQKC